MQTLFKRIEEIFLISECILIFAFFFLSKGIAQYLNYLQGGKPIAFLAELYFRAGCIPYLSILLILIGTYFIITFKAPVNLRPIIYILASLSLILFFLAGYIVSITLILF